VGCAGHGRRRRCERCTLARRLAVLLDDGTGQIAQPLLPLYGALVSAPDADAVLAWLRHPHGPGLLSAVATGKIPLTHDGLRQWPNWRAAAHLRDLLMACGVLPVAGKQLLHAETWLHRQLASLAGQPDERLLRQYGTWHQLPRLRARAGRRALTPAIRRFAAEEFTAARQFVAWLRQQGRTLPQCTQADLDAWRACHPAHRYRAARGFLRWAISARHMPWLPLPPQLAYQASPISQDERITLLQRILTGQDPPLRSRVAACLMLLYAQPASRLAQLTIDDITRDRAQVFLRLGDPPAPVPQPFATMLLQLAAGRANMNAPANQSARWLFPGQRAGQPLSPVYLGQLVRQLGVPARAARAAALRQLVLQAPAPVVARALGYNHSTTTRMLTEAGGTWTSYPRGHDGR
jgi:hypothetical protein